MVFGLENAFPPSVVELAHDWAPDRTPAGPERSGGLGGFAESCAGGLSCDNGTEGGGKLNRKLSSRLEWKNGMEAEASFRKESNEALG